MRRAALVLAVTLASLAAASASSGQSTMKREVIGYSAEHRAIVAWLVAAPNARRTMLVVGSIAGDEPAGRTVAQLLVSQRPIAGVNLWLIPDLNPDGAARGTRVNAHGVDLNRNFPYRWQHIGNPRSRYYSGRRPGSEPETRALEAFIRRVRPRLAVWIHQPFGLVDDSQGPRWAERWLGRGLGLPLERLPDYPGSAIGWEDNFIPRSGFDVELRGGGHFGRAATRLAVDWIRSLARRFAVR